jgi:hypothetical protein
VIERAGTLARNEILLIGDTMRHDADLLGYAAANGLCDPATPQGREYVRQILAGRNVRLLVLVPDYAVALSGSRRYRDC